MDFKQMFDAEELPTVLNAFYESGVKNDMLALVNEANKSVKFLVKTPNGMTETSSMHNKSMQGDAIRTENIYMFKNKVAIPPLHAR